MTYNKVIYQDLSTFTGYIKILSLLCDNMSLPMVKYILMVFIGK